MADIKLSPKHGLNPTVLHCPICGKETGVGLLGRLKGDVEAPRDMQDPRPCADCQKVLDQGGRFVIEVRDGEDGKENPYRTGRIVGVTTEYMERVFPVHTPLVAFCEHSIFEKLFGEHIK